MTNSTRFTRDFAISLVSSYESRFPASPSRGSCVSSGTTRATGPGDFHVFFSRKFETGFSFQLFEALKFIISCVFCDLRASGT